MPKTPSPTPDALLKPRKKPDVVALAERRVICRSGEGGPELPAFEAAVGALYGVAYTLKFARKAAGRENLKVGVLEGVWWAEGVDLPLDRIPDRETWRWRVRIAVPDDTTDDEVAAAIEAVTTRKGGKLEGSDEARKVSLTTLPAGRFGRILHIGPYAEEPRSFATLNELLAEQGVEAGHGHVEIYLSDPSRTAPERLRTGLLLPLTT